MNRKNPIRTYLRKNVEGPVINAYNSINGNRLDIFKLDNEKEDENIGDDKSLEYDPFDTTFDRLRKNAKIPLPSAQTDQNNSWSDSSLERTKEQLLNVSPLCISISLSGVNKKGKRKVNKPQLEKKNMSVAKGRLTKKLRSAYKRNNKSEKEKNVSIKVYRKIKKNNSLRGKSKRRKRSKNASAISSGHSNSKKILIDDSGHFQKTARGDDELDIKEVSNSNIRDESDTKIKPCVIMLDNSPIKKWMDSVNESRCNRQFSVSIKNDVTGTSNHVLVPNGQEPRQSTSKPENVSHIENAHKMHVKNCFVNVDKLEITQNMTFLNETKLQKLVSSTPIGKPMRQRVAKVTLSPINWNNQTKKPNRYTDVVINKKDDTKMSELSTTRLMTRHSDLGFSKTGSLALQSMQISLSDTVPLDNFDNVENHRKLKRSEKSNNSKVTNSETAETQDSTSLEVESSKVSETGHSKSSTTEHSKSLEVENSIASETGHSISSELEDAKSPEMEDTRSSSALTEIDRSKSLFGSTYNGMEKSVNYSNITDHTAQSLSVKVVLERLSPSTIQSKTSTGLDASETDFSAGDASSLRDSEDLENEEMNEVTSNQLEEDACKATESAVNISNINLEQKENDPSSTSLSTITRGTEIIFNNEDQVPDKDEQNNHAREPYVVLKRLQDPVRITCRRKRYRKWGIELADIVEGSNGSTRSGGSGASSDVEAENSENVTHRKKSRCSESEKDALSGTVSPKNMSPMKIETPVFLKPGKSWSRSLSILNHLQNESNFDELCVGKGKKWRHSVKDILDMQNQGVIQSCVKKDKNDSDIESQSSNAAIHKSKYSLDVRRSVTCDPTSLARLSKRVSIRVVPTNKTVRCIEDAPFLEAYGIIPVQNARTSIQTRARKTSVNDLQVVNEHVSATPREVVLQRCVQDNYMPFSEYFSDTYVEHCRKIGEGVYGEVFLYEREDEKSVIKIIPIEGSQSVNGEPQKKFHEILSEIVIAKELHNLRFNTKNNTKGFVEVKNIKCIVGKYPERLIELWKIYDEEKSSDNDCPSMFDEDQLYIVLELGHGGQDLEAFIFHTAEEAYALFIQAALALAVAEQAVEFEHRDLHWGNILVSRTDESNLYYKLKNKEVAVPSNGIQVSIIDFTLSRMSYQGCCIFNDLALDPALFTAQGEYQFEIYRLMRDKVENDWQKFEPYTNVLWLHYTLDKMITAVRYRNKKLKIHKAAIAKLESLKREILDYQSAYDFVTNCDIFSTLQCSSSKVKMSVAKQEVAVVLNKLIENAA